MTFRDTEKTRYDVIKGRLLTPDAHLPGHYADKPRSFCLADGHSAENLHESLRDEASVVHVAPAANRDFATGFTSPSLAQYGRTVAAAWSNLAPEGRFTPIPSESLLTAIEQADESRYHAWTDWLLTRYGWWRSPAAP